MTTLPNSSQNKAAIAARELMQLEKQTEKARLLLTRLQTGLIEAGEKIGGEATLLIEANQELVVAALRAQTLAEAAGLDSLTELPNRTRLLDRLEQAINVAKRRGTCLALLFLDINDFKRINDSLGHSAGDNVLQHVANCLSSVVRKADTVSRHGGDEFLILLAEVTQMSDATLIAEKIQAALIIPYHLTVSGQLDVHVLTLTASIGISIYPDHGVDASELIERADHAMYHAKRHGLGSYVYKSDEVIGDDLNLPKAPVPTELRNPPETASSRRYAHLREANERLIMAAFSAQNLQAGAEQAQHRQSTFLAVLAHELRNPLGPLRTAAALLDLVGSDPLKLQELQHLINSQVTRMARLLDDLFDVARVNSGKLTIVSEILDINALIHEVTAMYTPLIEERRQRFVVETPLGEIFVKGDPCRLTQIFSNLLDNAVKYTPEGGQIKLSVTIKADTLAMTLSDNGIGIIATALPHIFEPFVQGAAATGFNGDGLGIGLTVVRELVEAHKGHIIARSAGSGLGSQFIVTLPLLNPPVSPCQKESAP